MCTFVPTLYSVFCERISRSLSPFAIKKRFDWETGEGRKGNLNLIGFGVFIVCWLREDEVGSEKSDFKEE